MTDQITILRMGNHYTVVFLWGCGETKVVSHLNFDEMLGLVVKLSVPFCNNEPIFSPRQLFLNAPNVDVTHAEEQERIDNHSPVKPGG